MKAYLLLFAFLFLFATGQISAQESGKHNTELTSLVKQMTDAQLAYDAATLDRIFTADYIEISPLGEFDPRAKVLGFYAPDKKPAMAFSAKLDLSEYSIRIYNKFAVVIVKLTYQTTPARSIRATFVCRLERGAWRIASSQYTGIRPPQQAPKT